ncbi:MAG: DUF1415 domain-containing protein [Porticoccaceae bacterium]|nr:DUF1415 domain-containing protein [Porticoccaceae bacterium]
MNSNPHEAVIAQVRQWLKDVVIGFNFCPFAQREFDAGRIRYCVIDGAKKKQVLASLLDEFQFLDTHDTTETTLLIFADGFRDFYAYLDILDLAQQALEDAGYEGIYQLASFHPDYLFEGEPVDDAAHYTNRSPLPMLHLLREASIERAVAGDPNTDQIPERNKALARDKGAAFWQSFLSEQRSDLKP